MSWRKPLLTEFSSYNRNESFVIAFEILGSKYFNKVSSNKMLDGKQALLEKLRVLLFGWSDCCGVGEGDALGVKADDF